MHIVFFFFFLSPLNLRSLHQQMETEPSLRTEIWGGGADETFLTGDSFTVLALGWRRALLSSTPAYFLKDLSECMSLSVFREWQHWQWCLFIHKICIMQTAASPHGSAFSPSRPPLAPSEYSPLPGRPQQSVLPFLEQEAHC